MKKINSFVFLLVMSMIITACAPLRAASVKPTPTSTPKPEVTLTIPSYATYGSVLDEVRDRLYDSNHVQTISVVASDAKSEDAIGSGNVGILFLGSWSTQPFPDYENYGQRCNFAQHISYGLAQKVLVPLYTVSIDNTNFIQWCHDQFSKTDVYVVTANKLANGEYSIEYHKENWDINPTFTSPN